MIDFPTITRTYDNGFVSISPIDDPSENNLLIYDEDGSWKVYGTEDPYKIEFILIPDQFLSGVPDIDVEILAQLDDKILDQACAVDRYIHDICMSEVLWMKKIVNTIGSDMIKYKGDRTYRDWYMSLINTELSVKAANKALIINHLDVLEWLAQHDIHPEPHIKTFMYIRGKDVQDKWDGFLTSEGGHLDIINRILQHEEVDAQTN